MIIIGEGLKLFNFVVIKRQNRIFEFSRNSLGFKAW